MPVLLDVSVVIPVYNGERYVADAVSSALKQTLEPREVIVVDDGSTDSTADILADFGDRIRVISQPNRGVSVARNAGIRAATSSWIGQLDADDTWRPHKLERVAAVVRNQSAVRMVFSAVRHLSEDSRGAYENHRPTDLECQHIREELMARNVVLGGCSGPVIRRQCFKEVGLFDESLRSAEDWDMWIRIASRYEVRYVDEVLVDRREHPGSLSKNIDRMLECDIQVLEKHEEGFRARGASDRQLRRSRAAVYARSGVAYFCSGQIGKARGALLEALRLDPLSVKALVPTVKLMLGIPHKSGIQE